MIMSSEFGNEIRKIQTQLGEAWQSGRVYGFDWRVMAGSFFLPIIPLLLAFGPSLYDNFKKSLPLEVQKFMPTIPKMESGMDFGKMLSGLDLGKMFAGVSKTFQGVKLSQFKVPKFKWK